MGQAKSRGSLEQRVEQAKKREEEVLNQRFHRAVVAEAEKQGVEPLDRSITDAFSTSKKERLLTSLNNRPLSLATVLLSSAAASLKL